MLPNTKLRAPNLHSRDRPNARKSTGQTITIYCPHSSVYTPSLAEIFKDDVCVVVSRSAAIEAVFVNNLEVFVTGCRPAKSG